MPFKDFDAARGEREPIRFVLGGNEFSVALVSASAFLALATKADADGAEAMVGFGDFLREIIGSDEHEALAESLRRVELDELLELTTWLTEVATGRPLSSASSSPEESSPATP